MDLWKILNPVQNEDAAPGPSHNPSSFTTTSIFSIVDSARSIKRPRSLKHELGSDSSVSESRADVTFPSFERPPTPPYAIADLDRPDEAHEPILPREPPSCMEQVKPMCEEIQVPGQTPVIRRGDPLVIAAIEKMIERVVEGLLAKEDPCIELKTKRPPAAPAEAGGSYEIAHNKLKLLGRNDQEAWRFSKDSSNCELFNPLKGGLAVVLRILDLIHKALIRNVVVSKRYFILQLAGEIDHEIPLYISLVSQIC